MSRRRPFATVIARVAACFGILAPATLVAQSISPRSPRFYVTGAVLTAVTMPMDERIRELIWEHHPAAVDRIAKPLGDLGAPRVVYPVLLASAILPRLAGNRETSDAAIDIGLAYAASDVAGALLRKLIGRHRPDSSGNPRQFSPLRREHAWHSLPSGHAISVASLATGLSIKADRPWVNVASYTFAGLVDVQRIYERKHWASDVVAGSVLGIALTSATIRWRERHR